jgi:translocation and assembly module TamB
VPVAALAFFLEDPEDAAGQVTLHAGAQGPWNAIQWQIDAELAGVGFPIPYLSQNVHDVRGKLHVTSNQLTVSGFSGKIEEGVFSLQGAVKLKAFQPVQGSLTLTLDKLPVQVPDTMDIKINGDLTLTGAPSQALLQGTLTLLEGTYYKDLRLNLWSMVSVVTESKRSQPVPQTADKPQWMENIALDVTLNHRYPLQVDNNIANLDIVPDLKLTGTAARPILSGRATVTEGVVTFRGKSFPVTRGVVDFVNPNKIEPSLDLYSEAQIRGWLVHVSVSGTPDQLVVKLSSDPALAENDILSLILFGRTNAELTSGQGGATTQQMLAGLLASALGEDVKKTTGVDILEVDTGAKAAEDSADRIAVTVGKKLTERMTVKYVVESNNGEMIQRAVSEYRFMENVLASGFQDSKGRYGGELLFRMEFR